MVETEAKQLPKLGLQEALLMEDEGEKTELDKVIELLLKPENIQHNTELTKNEILAFSVLATIREEYPTLKVLKVFLRENLTNRVSKGRAGRKEIVKIVSRQLAVAEQQLEGQQASGFGRFFRRR